MQIMYLSFTLIQYDQRIKMLNSKSLIYLYLNFMKKRQRKESQKKSIATELLVLKGFNLHEEYV